jgi:hypothetical protein
MTSPACQEHAMERYGLNLDHPEILKAILLVGILETGDVIGRESGRTVLAVTVDDCSWTNSQP